MECDAAWLVYFANPYSHRHLGRSPFAQHWNYPKIDSSTKDYPKTTLTFFAFCRTVRKCVKALSENYPTKWCTFFMTIRNAKITIRKFFRSVTLARANSTKPLHFMRRRPDRLHEGLDPGPECPNHGKHGDRVANFPVCHAKQCAKDRPEERARLLDWLSETYNTLNLDDKG